MLIYRKQKITYFQTASPLCIFLICTDDFQFKPSIPCCDSGISENAPLEHSDNVSQISDQLRYVPGCLILICTFLLDIDKPPTTATKFQYAFLFKYLQMFFCYIKKFRKLLFVITQNYLSSVLLNYTKPSSSHIIVWGPVYHDSRVTFVKIKLTRGSNVITTLPSINLLLNG